MDIAMPKKVRLLAMKTLLSARFAEGRIIIVDNDSIEESYKAPDCLSLRRARPARTGAGRDAFSEDLKAPRSLRAGERLSQAASAQETLSASLSQRKSPRQLDRGSLYPRVAMRSTFDHGSPKRAMAPSIPALAASRPQPLQQTEHVFRSTHLVGELVRFKRFSGGIDLNKSYSLQK